MAAVPALKVALKDKQRTVCAAAAAALKRIDPKSATTAGVH
jgi:hypothetical protein